MAEALTLLGGAEEAEERHLRHKSFVQVGYVGSRRSVASKEATLEKIVASLSLGQ